MNEEPEQTAKPSETPVEHQPPTPAKHGMWWKSIAFWISIGSLICSLYSAFNTNRSANAATRSASAAATSANAAMTNADWVSYQRNPHHDVVAKVLRVAPVMRGYSSEDTNGLLYVDLALINNGNQSEIIRRVTLYYADTEMQDDSAYSPRILNLQLPKGDKQVLHLVAERRCVFTGKDVWLKVGVTAIGSDAEDIESKWLVAKLNLASDGNGAQHSPYPTNSIRVISNERLPHQRPADTTFM